MTDEKPPTHRAGGRSLVSCQANHRRERGGRCVSGVRERRPGPYGSDVAESQAAPGWYPVDGGQRYWDGGRWTDHFHPGPSPTNASAAQQERRDRDHVWQATGKPISGIGVGRYKLTAHYLFFEMGALRTDAQQVPISAVLDVDVQQSMTQKARGVGTIIVHIQRATRVEVVRLEDIPNFREGQRAINDTSHAARLAIQRNQNTMRYEGVHPAQGNQIASGAQVSSSHAPGGAPDYIDQLTRLGQLRDAGVLTEEEFQAKKAEILGRI